MSKKSLIPEAQAALNQLKNEIASETGSPVKDNNYSEMTSNQYGYMVKKMIEEQKRQIIDKYS